MITVSCRIKAIMHRAFMDAKSEATACAELNYTINSFDTA